MQIWYQESDIPVDYENTAITIGIFDGVHLGHGRVLAQTVAVAREKGLKALALTFQPHPRLVHQPDTDLHLITSLEDRLERLEAAGMDAVYVQHYDLPFAATEPRDFIENLLVKTLRAKAIIVGQDTRFGRNNSGDGKLLQEIGADLGIDVHIIADFCDASGRRWSSTWVRDLLAAGDVGGAAKVLGRPHRIRGVVEHGFKRGRELGFPTANLSGDNLGEVPAQGVYAGWLVQEVPGAKAVIKLPAAISIGMNPQFAGERVTVEAHVLGRADLNLYGQEIAIDFIEYLRPMQKFASVAQLLAQMDEDLRKCALVLGVPVSCRVNPADVTAK
ncbi:bifunctional riboflavin kinase/FAD synthetase [Arcanobacterium hippocoleae]|nr:bifunctional riboflavin kinase/FAD synthetase [Arcanobacterium hippocoleae]